MTAIIWQRPEASGLEETEEVLIEVEQNYHYFLMVCSNVWLLKLTERENTKLMKAAGKRKHNVNMRIAVLYENNDLGENIHRENHWKKKITLNHKRYSMNPHLHDKHIKMLLKNAGGYQTNVEICLFLGNSVLLRQQYSPNCYLIVLKHIWITNREFKHFKYG